jgi:hypothetical protein
MKQIVELTEKKDFRFNKGISILNAKLALLTLYSMNL